MIKCNVIIIEDFEEVCSSLSQSLKCSYHFHVKTFRDMVTFVKADENRELLKGFDEKYPIIIILDIMLAEEIDKKQPYAPRWKSEKKPSRLEMKRHVNDELGLKIGYKIRNGDFKQIAKNTPILFCTARQNGLITKQILEMGHAVYLQKPIWHEDIAKTIEDMVCSEIK